MESASFLALGRVDLGDHTAKKALKNPIKSGFFRKN